MPVGTETTEPIIIRKRRRKPGQEFRDIVVTLPKPQVDHLRSIAAATGKSMAAQVTEALAEQTGIGQDYLQDN